MITVHHNVIYTRQSFLALAKSITTTVTYLTALIHIAVKISMLCNHVFLV